jgi:hypothetical protein
MMGIPVGRLMGQTFSDQYSGKPATKQTGPSTRRLGHGAGMSGSGNQCRSLFKGNLRRWITRVRHLP